VNFPLGNYGVVDRPGAPLPPLPPVPPLPNSTPPPPPPPVACADATPVVNATAIATTTNSVASTMNMRRDRIAPTVPVIWAQSDEQTVLSCLALHRTRTQVVQTTDEDRPAQTPWPRLSPTRRRHGNTVSSSRTLVRVVSGIYLRTMEIPRQQAYPSLMRSAGCF
jgi:hypothetical protein